MDSYKYDTIQLSRIALHVVKKDNAFIDESIEFLEKHKDESGCIDLASILFSYYVKQYNIASTQKEKELVINETVSTFTKIFGDTYIDNDAWEYMLLVRDKTFDMDDTVNAIVKLAEIVNVEKTPITAKYIYRKAANYIINSELFCIEPYTSILEKMLNDIDGSEYDLSKQPNYLS